MTTQHRFTLGLLPFLALVACMKQNDYEVVEPSQPAAPPVMATGGPQHAEVVLEGRYDLPEAYIDRSESGLIRQISSFEDLFTRQGEDDFFASIDPTEVDTVPLTLTLRRDPVNHLGEQDLLAAVRSDKPLLLTVESHDGGRWTYTSVDLREAKAITSEAGTQALEFDLAIPKALTSPTPVLVFICLDANLNGKCSDEPVKNLNFFLNQITPVFIIGGGDVQRALGDLMEENAEQRAERSAFSEGLIFYSSRAVLDPRGRTFLDYDEYTGALQNDLLKLLTDEPEQFSDDAAHNVAYGQVDGFVRSIPAEMAAVDTGATSSLALTIPLAMLDRALTGAEQAGVATFDLSEFAASTTGIEQGGGGEEGLATSGTEFTDAVLPLWTCSADYTCVFDYAGEFTSAQDCATACRPPRWTCSSSYSCEQDPDGVYATTTACEEECYPPAWTCDNAYQCVVGREGDFSTLETCTEACQRPPRYTCTAGYQCVEDPSGRYGTLSDCTELCKPAPSYSCTSDFRCIEDASGTYSTLAWCETSCQPRYDCRSDYTCAQAAGGEYSTLSACQTDCQPPPVSRWTCSSTYQCVEGSSGPYSSVGACSTACAPPPKWTCSSNYQCVQGSSGTYSDLTACQQNCSPPPAMRYKCSGCNCAEDPSGAYSTADSCLSACAGSVSEKQPTSGSDCDTYLLPQDAVCRQHCLTKAPRDATFYYPGTRGCSSGYGCCANSIKNADGGWCKYKKECCGEPIPYVVNYRNNTGCFVEGTPIRLADGSELPVERLRQGQLLLDHTGEAHLIVNIVAGPERLPVLWLTPAGGPRLGVTSTHPMLTERGLLQAKELHRGDRLLLADGSFASLEVIEAMPYRGLVWNVELARNDPSERRWLLASGIVTGDLALQAELERTPEPVALAPRP
ncbi:MAG: hypothetical protein A2284_08175 [Deltaproteobacteria bacterium RIFOXYA12_FULL_61_11]|nr:MAG: hypothetical protein A2284_08175 [Deltaproteobacteria bacterium RIFOXYA12_FULL_61_11]